MCCRDGFLRLEVPIAHDDGRDAPSSCRYVVCRDLSCGSHSIPTAGHGDHFACSFAMPVTRAQRRATDTALPALETALTVPSPELTQRQRGRKATAPKVAVANLYKKKTRGRFGTLAQLMQLALELVQEVSKC